MQIHSMYATFGKLQGETLELKEGLNIIQAPNETGKSTWCAFLVNMLYGINSRERDRAGFIADKNRYLPWSGAPMTGRIDCRVGKADLTLMRITQRPNAPLGEFKAVYTGTGEVVPNLTGQNCGEALLGVSREIYERSAFIRQSGLSIQQSTELERRIAALISSGEEETSCTEAADTLKRQKNRRRHNHTGKLPALEAEYANLKQRLDDWNALQQELRQASARTAALRKQAEDLDAEIDVCLRWEAKSRQEEHSKAVAEAQACAQRAETLRRQLEEARIPENDAIGRLRGAIVNMQTTRRQLEKARSQRDEAMKAHLHAEAAVQHSPFVGKTAEEAMDEALAMPPKPRSVLYILAALCAVLLLCVAAAVQFQLLPLNISPLLPALVGVAGGAVLALCGKKQKKAQIQSWLDNRRRTYGTDDPEALKTLAEGYSALLDREAQALRERESCVSAADALAEALTTNEQAILLEIRRFAPAFDLSAADDLLRTCAIHRRELAEAEQAAAEAKVRLEQYDAEIEELENSAAVPQPTRPREAIEADAKAVHAALKEARSAADRLEGQLHAAGDPVLLQADLERIDRERAKLEEEYDAISLALDALEQADTTLQSRFSPALGHRTAEIFRELADNRYQNVSLDRSMHLFVEPAGDPVSRDALLLSAGAADQLYLAARLAICQLVLPPESGVPLVLDDALANFDDDRCAAALRWLKAESRNRQIILFTCHRREAEFFEGDEEVCIQRLTNAPKEV